MKILFLDIDGVVNSRVTLMKSSQGLCGIDNYMAFLVKKIVDITDCKVVLSSSWRHAESGREDVRKHVVDFIDVTPTGGTRGEEIQMWLDIHPEVTKYAILDDDSDMLPGQIHFKTSFETGLTDEIANAIIEYFNG